MLQPLELVNVLASRIRTVRFRIDHIQYVQFGVITLSRVDRVFNSLVDAGAHVRR
jgi:hypothetical protein